MYYASLAGGSNACNLDPERSAPQASLLRQHRVADDLPTWNREKNATDSMFLVRRHEKSSYVVWSRRIRFALKKVHWWKIIMILNITHGIHASVARIVCHSGTAVENVLALQQTRNPN